MWHEFRSTPETKLHCILWPKMFNKGLLLGEFAFLNLLATARRSVGFESELLKAAALLETVGITELCHPSSNDFAPHFPKCNIINSFEPRSLVASDTGENELGTLNAGFYIQNALMAVLCVCTAALAAGLTLGLLSLDPLNLLVKMRTALSEEEKHQAASLLPIVRQRHLLLVTLLLLNSMANEALPLFLDKLVPSYVAVLLSVTLVLFFGEIIPSAVFTGPDRIQVAARLAPLVRFFMCLFYPIAFPIAKVLDQLLHDDGDSSAFSRGELSALVRIQYEERLLLKKQRKQEKFSAALHDSFQNSHFIGNNKGDANTVTPSASDGINCNSAPGDSIVGTSTSIEVLTGRPILGRGQSLHFDEVTMLEGALHMKTKMALDVYTPLRNVFAVPYDVILTEARIVDIYSSGYSRVPVFRKRPNKAKDVTGIVGILLTKQLIVVNNNDRRPVCTLPLLIPCCVSPSTNLVDLINIFQSPSTRSRGGHMAIVCVRPQVAEEALEKGEPIPEKAGVMGIVTLEDCLEELLQEEIYDETDRSELQRLKAVMWAWRKWKLFVKKRKIKKEEASLRQMHEPMLLHILDAAQALDAAELGESTPLVDSTHTNEPATKPWFGLF